MGTNNSLVIFTASIILALVSFSSAYVPPPYEYRIEYYRAMPIDHFAFSNDGDTFDMRYLINDTYWDSNGGPIFFYCGNEGDIEMFAKNTGFMWDVAPDFKAMIVFAEHRFYGKTQPYGNKSYDMPYLGKLSSEQALADYAVFLKWLKATTPGAANSPVIALGGSYGGMLASWMRIKYPHIILGALASSAPILQFTGLTPCWTFSAIVTKSFREAWTDCDRYVNKSWSAIREKAKTKEGRTWLNENFKLCNDSTLESEDNATNLVNKMVDTWGSMAMINYPYPTDFLEPVPAWPIREACKKISEVASDSEDNEELLLGIYAGMSVFLNYTGQTKCTSLGYNATAALGEEGWGFQACTEMVMPMCNNGSDMFEYSPWNFTAFAASCHDNYGVKSRVDWATTNYGGRDLMFASNIIFSNGLLDPWYGGGVLQTISDSVVAIVIKEAAHHYDLRGKHPLDTTAVREARQLETTFMRKWIDKWRAALNRTEKTSASTICLWIALLSGLVGKTTLLTTTK